MSETIEEVELESPQLPTSPTSVNSDIVDFVISPNAPTYEGRLRWFEKILLDTETDEIPKSAVIDYIYKYGVPDITYLRSLCWKLVLGYLPWKKSEWDSTLKKHRETYGVFLKELTANPYEDNEADFDPLQGSMNEDDSKWSEYYKDEEIRSDIDKDVRRTYSSFHFFQVPVHPSDYKRLQDKQRLEHRLQMEEKQKKVKESQGLFGDDQSTDFHQKLGEKTLQHVTTVVATERTPTCHHDVLRRILFLFAKLNPGIRYVQGMNEILAPIYYVFANSPDPLSQYCGVALDEGDRPDQQPFGDAEADAFGCFMIVMSEIRDRFIKSMDHTETGVLAVVKKMNTLLKEVDPELWTHLDTLAVDPRYYSFRWQTLLMSQEFELPDVQRLWDSFFSDTQRFDFPLYFACAMIVHIRADLFTYDFADCIRTLQSYPFSDIQHLLVIANDLKQAHTTGKKSKFVQPPGKMDSFKSTLSKIFKK